MRTKGTRQMKKTPYEDIPDYKNLKDAAFKLHAEKKENSDHIQIDYVGNLAAMTYAFAQLIEDMAQNTGFSPLHILFGILAAMPSAANIPPETTATMAAFADYVAQGKEDEE